MTRGPQVLLADDDALSREFLEEALRRAGAAVTTADDGLAAVRLLERRRFDLVLTDLRMPRKSGLEVLKAAKELHPDLPVVLVTAYGTVDTAVQALRGGADDVLVKPVDLEQIEILLARIEDKRRLLAENTRLRAEVLGPRLLAQSPAMLEVLETIEIVAAGKATVLITGESGTGKEVVACELHRRSQRATGPFVKVNCAAVPRTLMESEFFGHEAGAFTGATSNRPGRFEAANGGTLLLDEIGEIPLELQAKLLRVLEDGVVQRVGGDRDVPVDVRVVAATNRDLRDEVAAGRFREDLFYRLNVLPIHLPPLRARKDDILPLAEQFLAEEAADRGVEPPVLDEEAAGVLLSYSWPGNVRELRNLMQRASIMSRDRTIRGCTLAAWLAVEEAPARDEKDVLVPRPGDGDPIEALVGRPLREVEDRLIAATLSAQQGNRTAAARILGVSPRTLYNRLKAMAPEIRALAGVGASPS